MSVSYGVCRLCGQESAISPPAETQEQADEQALEKCNCPGANTERQIKKGQERVRQLFGDEADELGFRVFDKPCGMTLPEKIF